MLNIFDILRKEHQEVNALINELISLENKDSYRVNLIEQIEKELNAHRKAEELTFYNTIKLLDADRDLVSHGMKEHLDIDRALETLIKKISFENQWKNFAIELKSVVQHHVEEEENELFTEAVTILTPDECVTLADVFVKMKARVLQGYRIHSDLVLDLMPQRVVERYNMTH